MLFRKQVQTIPDDPALPADVKEFAEAHAYDTNIIQLLNAIYKGVKSESKRVELYQHVTQTFQELIHRGKREKRRKHLINLMRKQRRRQLINLFYQPRAE